MCECLQARVTIKISYGKADALNVLNVINVRSLNSLNGLNVYQHPTQLTTRHNYHPCSPPERLNPSRILAMIRKSTSLWIVGPVG